MVSTNFLFLAVLILARLGSAKLQLAERVPQHAQRATFIGGIALFAETPNTGEDGVCPSYTQAVSASCCPDGCCPIGTFGYVNGDYCCPTDADCSQAVIAAPACANSTWILYARSSGGSDYFCCEPGQIAVQPNLCAPKGSQLATGATLASTIFGPAVTASTSPANSANSSVGVQTTSSSIASSSPVAVHTDGTSSSTSVSAKASTSAAKTTAPSSTQTSATSSSTAIVTTAAAGRTAGGDWTLRIGAAVMALGFGLRLIL